MDAVNFLNVEYIFLRVSDFFNNFDYISFLNAIIHFVQAINPYLIALLVFLVWLMIYSYVGLHRIEKEEDRKLFEPLPEEEAVEIKTAHDQGLHQKWKQVQTHINSTNPSDWRLAIIEADIMLDEILDKMGYQGDSIGDKLKVVDKSDFRTLDQAWDAHKVRNQIAHQGSDFTLNQREAERVIGLYKEVFEEFYHI